MDKKPYLLDTNGFLLEKPYEYRPWLNYLGNGEYGLRIGHLGDAFSTTLEKPRTVITNYDFAVPNKGRFVYVKDETEQSGQRTPLLWNPSFYPTKTPLDHYRCRHAPGYTSFDSDKAGLRVESAHFLPRKGRFEIWRLKVTNQTKAARKVTVYPMMEFLLYPNFGVDPIYYSWYTNTRLEADGRTIAVFKTDAAVVYGFLHSLAKPDSWEGSLNNFRGSGDVREPQGPLAPQLSGVPSAGDPYIGCFQYQLELKPGESWETALFIGEGEAVRDDCAARFPDLAAVDAEFAAVKADWKRKCARPEFAREVEGPFKGWLSSFFPYQVWQQSTGLVRSIWRGYRDVAQDAIGMSYFDQDVSRQLIITLLDKQHPDGRCLRQWNTSGSYNDERDFRDLPLWLPLAVDKYLAAGGNPDILVEKKPYLGGGEAVTLWEHLQKGLEYVLRFGPHELIEMGVGDWNDALSGLGATGESLWLNQAAYLALEKVQAIFDSHGHKFGLDLRLDCAALRERLYQGVAKGWTGQWFLRGYHQDGRAIGGPERIFLLPQAWFTISGMATRDPEKAKIALDSMVERLDNPAGLLKCHPAFDKFDPTYGNLSALAPGMAENFAVYALYTAGRDAEAKRYLDRLIPVYKDPDLTKAEPYVLVNFYNGGYYPEKAGQGGIPWLTGTVNWFAMIYFDQLAARSRA
jgi:cellobiose phosphorylase